MRENFLCQKSKDMVKVENKALCSGCTACAHACPHSCIVMKRDQEGFLYPDADTDKCVDCGICEAVCPYNSDMMMQNPIRTEAVCIKDSDERMQSSSGGIFSAMARHVIRSGGVVCGAVYDEKMRVIHICTDMLEDLSLLRGSKYLQSDLGNTFSEIAAYLKKGRMVLFTGTGCQVRGLLNYIGKRDRDGLVTVEIACSGVPSPLLWERYLSSGQCGKDVSFVNFRDKSYGWHDYHVAYHDGNNKPHLVSHKRDEYLAAFYSSLSVRPSCYSCRFNGGSSGADLKIGDFWNVKNVLPDMDDNKGISSVIVYTRKGHELMQVLTDVLVSNTIRLEDAARCNNGFGGKNIPVPKDRNLFFSNLKDASDIKEYILRFVGTPEKETFLRKLRKSLIRIKIIFS